MTTGETYAELSNKTVSAANGVDYVYRDAGEGGVPLVLLQHGGTTGNTPRRIEQMAQDAIAFLRAMEFDQVDMLGFFVGQEMADAGHMRAGRSDQEDRRGGG